MWNWENGHMDDGWGVAMMIGMTATWVAIVALVVYLVVSAERTRSAGRAVASSVAAGVHSPGAGAPSAIGARGSAEQVLAERFARGEIDADEYRMRLEVLVRRSQP